MALLPVIERELRASARRSATYTLRMFSVLAVLAVTAFFGFTSGFGPQSGGELFAREHVCLMLAIWLLVPFLASDSISRERREGTLPLLSLTPLSAANVAWAKTISNGLRAFSIWLAVLPVFSIALLLGGVSRGDFAFALSLHIASLVLALSCGILASAFSRSFVRAQALTGLLAFCAAVAMLATIGTTATANFAPWPGFQPRYTFENIVEMGAALCYSVGELPWRLGMGVMNTQKFQLTVGCMLAILCVVSVYGVTKIAAWRVRALWRDRPVSPLWSKTQDVLCRPMFFQDLLKRWMKRRLERNPVGWLEQRTWNGRLVMWSWMAVVVSFYSYLLVNFDFMMRGFDPLQSMLSGLLALSMAFSAAGSFRRERESGVLELLLVSPLNERELILGRLLGLYQQFALALILLFSVWVYVRAVALVQYSSEWKQSLAVWAVTFVTLPVTGFYFSLSGSNFMGSFLRTLFIGMVLPFSLGHLLESTWSSVIVQLATSSGLGFLLYYRLSRRLFPLDRAVTT